MKLTTSLFLSLGIGLFCTNCQSNFENDLAGSKMAEINAAVDFNIKNDDFGSNGYYTITTAGTYTVKENIGSTTSRKAIIINVGNTNDITIDGGGYTLYGKCTYNESGDNNVILCSSAKSANINNLKINGNGSNAIRIADGVGSGSEVKNINIVNPSTSTCRPGGSGGGGIEIGKGTITSCVVKSGDDAIKISEPGAYASGGSVTMQGNGSAIQFGYDTRCNGANHTATGITIYGNTSIEDGDTDETNDKPNYSAIGGHFGNNDISNLITDVTISSSLSFRHIVKLYVAANAKVTGVNIKANCVKGINNRTNSKGKVFHPILLVVKDGATLKGNITLAHAPGSASIGDYVRLVKGTNTTVDITINGKNYK